MNIFTTFKRDLLRGFTVFSLIFAWINSFLSLHFKYCHFLFRLRIDNVPEVTIKSIILRPNDTVDFWFSGIHQNLTLSGAIECPDCSKQELEVANLTSPKKPKLNIHVIKSGSVLLDNFIKESQSSELNFKVRDLDALTVVDSYFAEMPKGSMELFNVPSVYVMHSEFHYCKDGFLVANSYVKNITIVDCLLEDKAVSLLANETTQITKKCSISPLIVSNQIELGPECENSVIGRWVANHGLQNHGVETTGVITLALVSSAILMTVVMVLFSWHRQGKLDAYL